MILSIIIWIIAVGAGLYGLFVFLAFWLGIFGAIVGAGGSLYTNLKNRRFFNECETRQVGKPNGSELQLEKVGLIAKKHNISEGYSLYCKMHQERYNPQPKQMDPDAIAKRIVGAFAISGAAIGFYFGYTLAGQINSRTETIAKIMLGLLFALIGAIGIGFLIYGIVYLVKKSIQSRKELNEINHKLDQM